MPYINFSNPTDLEKEVIITFVTACIDMASHFGGKVYGGFVRDYLVPHLHDKKQKGIFKDVDIWFESQTSADDFVAAMHPLFVPFHGINVTEGSYPGAFSRRQYYITMFESCLAWVDVVVSPNLPVNDFDVNEVTYSIVQSGPQTGEWVTTSSERLIHQILNKHAIMLPSYHKLIEEASDSKTSLSKHNPRYKDYYTARMERIFYSKGWKVSTLQTKSQ